MLKKTKKSGFLMLEALISILIVGICIGTLLGLQAQLAIGHAHVIKMLTNNTKRP